MTGSFSDCRSRLPTSGRLALSALPFPFRLLTPCSRLGAPCCWRDRHFVPVTSHARSYIFGSSTEPFRSIAIERIRRTCASRKNENRTRPERGGPHRPGPAPRHPGPFPHPKWKRGCPPGGFRRQCPNVPAWSTAREQRPSPPDRHGLRTSLSPALASPGAAAGRWKAGRPDGQAGSRWRNSRQAAATSGAFRMADTTQMRVAPAASTESKLPRWRPPIANQGTARWSAAHRT